MGPKKKSNKLTDAEKQRLYRERRKNNPEKEEEAKRKDRERYHAKKKLVDQLSQRALRARRKQVRERVQQYRKNQLIPLSVTPPDNPCEHQSPAEIHDPVPGSSVKTSSTAVSSRSATPSEIGSKCLTSTPISRQSQFGRKKVRKEKSKLYRDNERLISERDAANRRAEKYRKRAERLEKRRIDLLFSVPKDKMSPKSLTERTVKECLPGKLTPKKKKIAKQLFMHNTTSAVMKKVYTSFSKVQQGSLKKAVAPILAKYRIAHPTLASFLGIKSGIRKHVPIAKKLSATRKAAVESFFLRDDNSRATAGKKETVTKNQEKKQKRFLCDSMKNLYRKYLREGGTVISYATFTSCRPFHVVIPTAKDRETCLCKLHTNLQIKANKLKHLKVIDTDNIKHLAYGSVCDPRNAKCMYEECKKCKSTAVSVNPVNGETLTSWWEWNTATVTRKSNNNGKEEVKNVKKIVKVQKEGTVTDLTNSLQKQMKIFCKHIFNIRQQFLAYRECRDNLQENEALLHIDFSENYSCKIGAEIQSFHFGGSRAQVTLHTGIAYIANIKEHISFCSVSSDRRHNPAAIWAHLDPVIKLLKNTVPAIDTLHFFSDGPVTQYRQKENFYLFSKRLVHYGCCRGTWSFFEAGHGKGAADGIGGAVKRTADRLVTYGHDITNAEQFFEALKKEETTVKLFFVATEEIDSVCQQLPTNIPTLKGTLQVHQLSTELEGQLKHRYLSCFCNPQRGFCKCFPYTDFCLKNVTMAERAWDKSKGCKKRKRQQSTSDSESENFELIRAGIGGDYEEEDDSITAEKSVLSEDIPMYVEVTPDKIKKGVFLLAEFLGNVRKRSRYRYVGVTQEDLDDDGCVRVMFLKVYGDSGFLYKMDENDVSDIEFGQIKKILPTPSPVQKGDRILYKFPYIIDVYEK